MGSINKDLISRFETTAVYTHPDAKVDIVLVHGLNGEPKKTWTASNGVYWPTDLLPDSLKTARANILVYGYNADVYSKKHGSAPSDNFIHVHAQTLVTSLTVYRKEELSSRNPILWVCHSLGGILVKRALLYSNDLKAAQQEDMRSIYVSTYGLIFLGTPHTGSGIANWAIVLQAMSDAVVMKKFFETEGVLLKTLKSDNEVLTSINSHWLDVYQRFQILFCHETQKTDLKGTKALVVDVQSASPQLPGVAYYAIEATHSKMCKFESKNAPGYRTVASTLREWVVKAPDVIETRWRVEEEEKKARARHEIEERMKPWLNSTQNPPSDEPRNNELPPSHHSSQPKLESANIPALPEPPPNPSAPEQDPEMPSQNSAHDSSNSKDQIFVKPTVFRPNSYFKGRDDDLRELHRKLMDKGRRAKGTSSVLIQCLPGGGKTHLARQYVFSHKHDFPGGIFWIRAKSIQELEYGYWDIAKAAGLHEHQDIGTGTPKDTRQMVKSVRKWLNSVDKWLLVLDGVHFDFPGLPDFIPDAKHTSMIYTSTERAVGEAYQFDDPQILVLDPLSQDDARDLLLEEMEKRQPWNSDDLNRASELVELMERLPLMIHVAALQLKATREPLSKYLRSYRKQPKVGNLPAYQAVREQLENRGEVAALNLMYIISFFGQSIPVEMVALGSKALDKRTPIRTQDPEKRKISLQNTLKVLIAFAMIERNENNEAASASSKSSRSVDMGQDTLDILRIHKIVQAFFVDFLAIERQAPFWLERAACVFCYVFDESDRRIREDPNTGVPEDYRRFSIHGDILLSHVGRFEKRVPELAIVRHGLEARLACVHGRIEELNRRLTNASSTGSVEPHSVSVFERNNSLSELDSDTPPSNSSIEDWHLGEDMAHHESPGVYSPTEHNPYHWHTPYPYTDEAAETSQTVTPQPPPTEIFENIPSPIAEDGHSSQSISSNHRTIRRYNEHRYRDHAGAWRAAPQILSDPRTSLSREPAKGLIVPPSVDRRERSRSSSRNRLTAVSDAELSLNKIKRSSPPPPRGGSSFISNKVRTISGGSITSTRPKLVGRGPSYANPQSATAIEDEEHSVSPTFSSALLSHSNPTSYTAATIKRLKEDGHVISTDGLTPIKVSSPLTHTPLVAGTAPMPSAISSQAMASDLSDLERVSQPGGTPSRSARSSPMHGVGPFRPPPIPIEVNTTSALHMHPGHTLRHWETYGRTPELAVADEEEDPMSLSMPSIKSQPVPYPRTVQVRPDYNILGHPPSWIASAGASELLPPGYSSQPMSRDASHQSSGSHSSPGSQVQRSSPHAKLHKLQMPPRSRRPSLVETEPSPVLDNFGIEPTSYQLYEAARGRRNAGSGQNSPTGTTNPNSFFSRFGRGRGRSQGGTQRRAESASGRLINLDKGKGKENASPDLRRESGSGPASPTAESMERSGSAGFRMPDGSVVEFGQTGDEGRLISMAKGNSSARGSPGRAPRRGSGGAAGSSGGAGVGGVGLGIQEEDDV